MKTKQTGKLIEAIVLIVALVWSCNFLSGCGGALPGEANYVRETVPSGSTQYTRYATNIEELSEGWEEDDLQEIDGSIALKDSFLIRISIDPGEETDAVLNEICASSGYSPEQFEVIGTGGQDWMLAFVSLPEGADVVAEMEKFAGISRVEEAYPNVVLSQSENTYEQYDGGGIGDNWAEGSVNLPESEEIESIYSAQVLVAVLDTGLEAAHPSFVGIISPEAGESNIDLGWHGTFVAGIIAAAGSSADGTENPMRGVAEGRVALLPVIVCNNRGQCPYADVISGLEFAVEKEADVIHLSICASAETGGLKEFIETAAEKSLVVSGACNSNEDATAYLPAVSDLVMTVGAITQADARASETDWGAGAGSNFGVPVDVSAPGDYILSTTSSVSGSLSGYITADGTSIAAAWVSGLAALLFSVNEDFTIEYVRNVIIETAIPITTDQPLGAGRINIRDAFEEVYSEISKTAEFVVSCDESMLYIGETTECSGVVKDQFGMEKVPSYCFVDGENGTMSTGGLFKAISAGGEKVVCTYSTESAEYDLNIIAAACYQDSECDDGDPLTIDTCSNPGGAQAACTSAPCTLACSANAECDDLDPLTIDSCTNAGTCDALCTNAACAVECTGDTGCDDGNVLTIDVCSDPGTCLSSCNNTACTVACYAGADCDDSDSLTQDTCSNPGLCTATCVNTPCTAACNIDADCNDSDPLTIDACTYPGTCEAQCLNVPCSVECSADADCDDGDSLTTDTCSNPGTCVASCNNISCVVCSDHSDCSDGDYLTTESCMSAGTCGSYCSYITSTGWMEWGAGSAAGEGVSSGMPAGGDSIYPVLAKDLSGDPVLGWITYNDGAGSATDIHMKAYNAGSWNTILSASVSFPELLPGEDTIHVTVDSTDAPVITWAGLNSGGGAKGIFVKRFSGGVWNSLGTSGADGGISGSIDEVAGPAVAAGPGGVLYVAWNHRVGSRWRIYTKKWNGSSWSEIGSGSASGNGLSLSSGNSSAPDVAVCADGKPVVAWYHDGTNEAMVRKWNGSSWSNLSGGDALEARDLALVSLDIKPHLACDTSGNPVILWMLGDDILTAGFVANVARWNGGSWTSLGHFLFGIMYCDISDQNQYSALSIDSSNTIYAACIGDQSSANLKTVLMMAKYYGASWGDVTSGSRSGGIFGSNTYGCRVDYLSMVLNGGVPLVAWSSRNGDCSSSSHDIFTVKQIP